MKYNYKNGCCVYFIDAGVKLFCLEKATRIVLIPNRDKHNIVSYCEEHFKHHQEIEKLGFYKDKSIELKTQDDIDIAIVMTS